MKPFEVKYHHISEIRHGSPYNLVELEFIGKCEFEIEKTIVGKTNIPGRKIEIT